MSDKEIVEIKQEILGLISRRIPGHTGHLDENGYVKYQLANELDAENLRDEILSHPNIAVINPDAELPRLAGYPGKYNQVLEVFRSKIKQEGWIKEVLK